MVKKKRLVWQRKQKVWGRDWNENERFLIAEDEVKEVLLSSNFCFQYKDVCLTTNVYSCFRDPYSILKEHETIIPRW